MIPARKLSRELSKRVANAARDLRHRLTSNTELFQSARGGRIVNYHGICQRGHLRYNTLFLTQRVFEAQLKFFAEHFNVVTLADFYGGAYDETRFNICLTFDDGFANNHRYVLPLLEKYRLPATFFITGIGAADYDVLWNDFLSIISRHGPARFALEGESYRRVRWAYVSERTGQRLNDTLRSCGFAPKAHMMTQLRSLFAEIDADPDYWLQMTVEQIRDLAGSPWATIGSHGFYHNDLSAIPPSDAAEELMRSREYLEGLTNRPVTSLAFPYGAYDGNVVAAARAAGYTELLATDFRSDRDHDDPALRERMTVNPFISVAGQMHAIVTGRYD